MPLILPGNVGSATAATGFNVANSVRMNAADSAKMTIDFSGAGNQKKFTISCWVKRATITPGASQTILSNYADVNNFGNFTLNTSDKLSFVNRDGGTFNTNIATTRLFRDPSSFYHVVLSVDTTQGTDTNRIKMYVNGVQETSFSTSTYPDQNTDLKFNTTATTNFGSWSGSAQYADGYYSELCFINDAQLAADQFGEFDEDSGIWKPIDVSELTFGTNGFYLDFEDSANLGNDANGGTDLTEVNLAATDQSTDTCTNNFATMNPLDNFYPASTFTEGNLKVVSGSSPYSSNTATFGLSSGKWYYEFKYLARGGSEDLWHVGIKSTQDTSNSQMLGHFANDYGYRAYNGKVRNNNGDITYGNTWTVNDIIGVYIDLDNSKLYFAKNGTVQNSGTGISITAVASTPLGVYLPAISWNDGSTTGTCSLNFGSPMDSTGGNADANGFGSFEYNPSSGTFDSASKNFLAICTKNLAEHG